MIQDDPTYLVHFLTIACVVFSGAIVCSIGALICYAANPNSRWLIQWSRQHSVWILSAGAVWLIVILVVSTQLEGWYSHGVASMVAGANGLSVLMLLICLRAEPRVGILPVLAGTSCLAFVFSGYTTGFRELNSRARMIHDLKQAGAQFECRQYVHNRDDHIDLPEWCRRMFFDANFSIVSIRIPDSQLREGIVENWHYDDLQEIAVFSETMMSYQVDVQALKALPSDGPLDRMYFPQGLMDRDALASLSQFPKLRILSFACEYQPVDSQLSELTLLRELYLREPVVDSGLVKMLEQMKGLRRLTLLEPRLQNLPVKSGNHLMNMVCLTDCTVDENCLSYFGQFAREIRLRSCRVELDPKKKLKIPAVQSITSHYSTIDDSELMMISRAPRLLGLVLVNAETTEQAEAKFRKQNPRVQFLVSDW